MPSAEQRLGEAGDFVTLARARQLEQHVPGMRRLERILRSVGMAQDEIEADARHQLEGGERRPGEPIGAGEEASGLVELG